MIQRRDIQNPSAGWWRRALVNFSSLASISFALQSAGCTLRPALLVIALAGASMSIWADEQLSSKAKLSVRLATLLDQGGTWQRFQAECMLPTGTLFDPDVIYRSQPSYFGGISPKSVYWPRIRQIYRGYQSSVCTAISPSVVDDTVALQLNSALSEDDIRVAIAFYSTDAGRRISQASGQANDQVRKVLSDAVRQLSSTAYVSTTKALTGIAQEFQKNPR